MLTMKQNFWSKVEKCKHENNTDYSEFVYCMTEYCEGDERRCADCKVYIQTCGCGYNDGMSGWSQARHKSLTKKE